MKNTIHLLADKYFNLINTSINESITALLVNKLIHSINKNFTNFISSKSNISHLFNKTLSKVSRTTDIINKITIIISKIKYRYECHKDKLIIKTNSLNHVCVHTPDTDHIKANLSEDNTFIDLFSKNKHYITNLASIIKNIKKIDKCTGIGMYYSNENIIFKRKIKNDNK